MALHFSIVAASSACCLIPHLVWGRQDWGAGAVWLWNAMESGDVAPRCQAAPHSAERLGVLGRAKELWGESGQCCWCCSEDTAWVLFACVVSQSRGSKVWLMGREPRGSGNDSLTELSRFMRLFLKRVCHAILAWLHHSTAARAEPARPQLFQQNNSSGQYNWDKHSSTGLVCTRGHASTHPRAR